jgi:hypothetical protein
MNTTNVAPAPSISQVSPLEILIGDLRDIRAKMLATEKRRRSGVLAGQLLILARSYQVGRRPSRRTLKRFFWFVSGEAA